MSETSEDFLGRYLDDTGKLPLLQHSEEVELGQRMDRERKHIAYAFAAHRRAEAVAFLTEALAAPANRMRRYCIGSTTRIAFANLPSKIVVPDLADIRSRIQSARSLERGRIFAVVRAPDDRLDEWLKILLDNKGSPVWLQQLKASKRRLDGLRNVLAERNMRLVAKLARSVPHGSAASQSLADRMQNGALGLMVAIRKWSYKRGLRFATYATWWVHQSIARGIAEQTHMVRASSSIRQQLMQDYTHGRNTTQDDVRRLAMAPPISLDMPISDDSDAPQLSDVMETETLEASLTDGTQNRLRRAIQALYRIPHQDARLIVMHYGLFRTPVMSLQSMGEELGMSRKRVNAELDRALSALRDAAEDAPFV